jgi:hypothetical protein
MMDERTVKRMGQVEQMLEGMGGTHALADIIDMLSSGEMQSFSDGDTWVVTQVVAFPRKKVLEIFLVVGTLEGAHGLKQEVFDFAAKVGCQLIRAFGRDGWVGEMQKGDGWHNGARIFWREV